MCWKIESGLGYGFRVASDAYVAFNLAATKYCLKALGNNVLNKFVFVLLAIL